MTNTERVWNVLRASKLRAGVGVQYLATATGLERRLVMTALRKLKDAGHIIAELVQIEGGYMVGRYKAVPGIKRLPDGRGHHPNSRPNLAYFEVRKVRRVKSSPVPKPATALEQCWQPVAISSLAND